MPYHVFYLHRWGLVNTSHKRYFDITELQTMLGDPAQQAMGLQVLDTALYSQITVALPAAMGVLAERQQLLQRNPLTCSLPCLLPCPTPMCPSVHMLNTQANSHIGNSFIKKWRKHPTQVALWVTFCCSFHVEGACKGGAACRGTSKRTLHDPLSACSCMCVSPISSCHFML